MPRRRKKRKAVDFVPSETTALRRLVALLCYAGLGVPFALPFVLAKEEFMRHHLARAAQVLLLYLASVFIVVSCSAAFPAALELFTKESSAGYLLGMPSFLGLAFFGLVWFALTVYYSWEAVELSLTGKAWPGEPGLVTVTSSLLSGVTGAALGFLIGLLIVISS